MQTVNSERKWNIGHPGGLNGPFYSVVKANGNVVAMQIPDLETAELIASIPALIEDKKIYEDALWQIHTWSEAYPVSAFPEPDFKKAAAVLKDNGLTLDAISASNMRHVLDGVMRIAGGVILKGIMAIPYGI